MKKRFSPSSRCSTTLFETFVYGGCHLTQGREGRMKWHNVVKYFPDAFADNILDSGTLSFSGRTRAHHIAGPKRFYFTICNRWGPSYERCICLKRCTYAHHLRCLLHNLMFYTSFFYGNHQNNTNILQDLIAAVWQHNFPRGRHGYETMQHWRIVILVLDGTRKKKKNDWKTNQKMEITPTKNLNRKGPATSSEFVFQQQSFRVVSMDVGDKKCSMGLLKQ